MCSADIHTVALILGHKDLRMAIRYQHLSPAFLSDAVLLLDGAFAEAIKTENVEKEQKFRLQRPHSVPGKGDQARQYALSCLV